MAGAAPGSYLLDGTQDDAQGGSYPIVGELDLHPIQPNSSTGTVAGKFIENSADGETVSLITGGEWSGDKVKFQLRYGAGGDTYHYEGIWKKNMLAAATLHGQWQEGSSPSEHPNEKPSSERGTFKFKIKMSKEKHPRQPKPGQPAKKVEMPSHGRPQGTKTAEYVVHVVTGTEEGAGTDSRVTVQLVGDKGASEAVALDLHNSISKNEDLFEDGQTDVFLLDLGQVELGQVVQVRVETDNSGFGPNWFLDRVEVVDCAHANFWSVFPAARWLGAELADGTLHCTLPCRSHDFDGMQQAFATIQKLQADKASLLEAEASLKEENSRLSDIVANIEREKAEEAQRAGDGADAKARAEAQAANMEAQHQDLLKRTGALAPEVERSQENLHQLEDKHRSVLSEIAQAEANLSALQASLQEVAAKVGEVQAEVSVAEGAVGEARQQRAALDAELVAVNEQLDRQRAELKLGHGKLHERAAHVNKALEGLEEEVARKEETVAAVEAELAEHRAAVAERRAEAEAASAEAREAEAEVEQHRGKVAVVKGKAEVARKELEEKEAVLRDREAERAAVDAALADVTKNFQAAKQQERIQRDATVKVLAAIDASKAEKAALEEQDRKLRLDIPSMAQQVEALNGEAHVMSARVATAKSLRNNTLEIVTKLLGEARELLQLENTAFVQQSLGWDKRNAALSVILRRLIHFRDRLDSHANTLVRMPNKGKRLSTAAEAALSRLATLDASGEDHERSSPEPAKNRAAAEVKPKREKSDVKWEEGRYGLGYKPALLPQRVASNASSEPFPPPEQTSPNQEPWPTTVFYSTTPGAARLESGRASNRCAGVVTIGGPNIGTADLPFSPPTSTRSLSSIHSPPRPDSAPATYSSKGSRGPHARIQSAKSRAGPQPQPKSARPGSAASGLPESRYAFDVNNTMGLPEPRSSSARPRMQANDAKANKLFVLPERMG